ncbi:heparan-sulfate 6-O-sulfotransferase 2 [Elysia marginata]|uniref:Heparan-sulfate 6-O-sulfotransferase 2 n=1 Tax=Elysia marginata TaxID=1093978 RepID=A0AAV4FEV2_9GAST|nr:heparan-sulfate 6-O-sulfotransferase 2 [Elysia marginata]
MSKFDLFKSFPMFRRWTYYKFHMKYRVEISQVWMAAASSAAIFFWIGTYIHLSSSMIDPSDTTSVERALAAEARISGDNFAFWRTKGLRMADSAFIKFDPDGVRLDDVQAYRSNLLIRHTLPAKDVQVRPVNVNFNASDVLVMLHIQKTGGTSWDNHLVLNLDPACNCHGMNERTRRVIKEFLSITGWKAKLLNLMRQQAVTTLKETVARDVLFADNCVLNARADAG